MNNKKCPKPSNLIQYIDRKLSSHERVEISSHLLLCNKCSEHIKTLKNFAKIKSMKSTYKKNPGFEKTDQCISDDLLFRYIEGTATEDEIQSVEAHVNSCEACFFELSSLMKNLKTPATAEELQNITKLKNISAEQQVEKILSQLQTERLDTQEEQTENEISKPVRTVELLNKNNFTNIIKEFWSRFFLGNPVWKPILVTAIMVVIVLGIYKGTKFYNTTYQIRQAESLLLDQHRIFIENARLSGGYLSTGVSMLMSGDEKPKSYVEVAKERVERAIAHGDNSIETAQLLARVLIINKEYDRVDSLYSHLDFNNIDNAVLLNDAGVYYFQKKEWQQAANYFKKAMSLDENLLEAYFNLALVNMKLNRPYEAIVLLEKYVESEKDEGWRDAALRLKNIIIKNKDG